MQTVAIVWMYVVGLGVTYSLLHRAGQHWSQKAIIIGWPVMIPLVMLLAKTGTLKAVRQWAETKI